MMTEPAVNVFLVDFPNSGREMVIPNEDDSYTILINAKLSYESQLKAYEHAMQHILNDDFSKDNVQEIEAVAHERTKSEHADSISEESKTITTLDRRWIEERIKRLRRERRQIRKKMKEYNEAIQKLQDAGVDFFAKAEHFYLYGRDY